MGKKRWKEKIITAKEGHEESSTECTYILRVSVATSPNYANCSGTQILKIKEALF